MRKTLQTRKKKAIQRKTGEIVQLQMFKWVFGIDTNSIPKEIKVVKMNSRNENKTRKKRKLFPKYLQGMHT